MSSSSSDEEEKVSNKITYRDRLKKKIISKQSKDNSLIDRILKEEIKFAEPCVELMTKGLCQNELCLYQHNPKLLICKHIYHSKKIKKIKPIRWKRLFRQKLYLSTSKSKVGKASY
jgi:hypothetical protein